MNHLRGRRGKHHKTCTAAPTERAGEHFKANYGPAIAHEWNRGTEERARFEKQYLRAVGTRTAD